MISFIHRKTKAARQEAEKMVGGLREATADRQFLVGEADRLQGDLDAALVRRSDKQADVQCVCLHLKFPTDFPRN